MNYTPGPWEVIEVKGSYKIPFVVAAGEKRVATCTGDQLNPEGTSIGEARANARLIAAAPELVEALEGFLNPANFRLTHGDSVFENARALLARIKGE